jgi:hypothetical protein
MAESAARTAQVITSLKKGEQKSLSFWREEQRNAEGRKEKAQCLCEMGDFNSCGFSLTRFE